jgi:hypothetical protein
MVYMPEQNQLVTAGYDNMLRVYDACSGLVKDAWPCERAGRLTGLLYSPQRQQVGGLPGWRRWPPSAAPALCIRAPMIELG